MVLISEVGDYKGKVVFGNPNYCPFILLLGPCFATFFFPLLSLALICFILPPSFRLVYLVGTKWFIKRFLKCQLLEKQENHTQSAPPCFLWWSKHFLYKKKQLFFSPLKTHNWAIQRRGWLFRLRLLKWDWGNIHDWHLSHWSVKDGGGCLPVVTYLQM